jgi:hypothetical protein
LTQYKYKIFVCPPDDTAITYTANFTLHPHEDGQQYLVLTDNHLHLEPSNLLYEFGNLFNGNKVLGKLTVAYCKILQQQRVDTDIVN